MKQYNKLIQHFCEQGPVILLESQSDSHPASQKTYLAALPEAELSIKNGQLRLREPGQTYQKKNADPWQALETFRKKYGWVFGYVGYDLKNTVEDLTSRNEDPIDAADLYFMAPAFLLEIDNHTSKNSLLKGEMPAENKISSNSLNAGSYTIKNMASTTSRQDYLKQIKKAKQLIKEGEFYEINLSRQLYGDFSGSAFKLYRKMREGGRVPFGAYIQNDEICCCCQSPERFLKKKGQKLLSQPIKGTAGRSDNVREDRLLKTTLAQSEKEKTENIMIVDLVRNDLSRTASPGTVNVPRLWDIETFESVHQMVSTVEASTDEQNICNILKQCFPMASMTGTPKIRVMEAIEELEDYRRGIYSGAIGYITPEGDFDFNVVIRSAIIKGDCLHYSTGGAITADSNPTDEWEETEMKAKALKNVI